MSEVVQNNGIEPKIFRNEDEIPEPSMHIKEESEIKKEEDLENIVDSSDSEYGFQFTVNDREYTSVLKKLFREDSDVEEVPNVTYQCNICNKIINRRYIYNRHMQKHQPDYVPQTPTKSFICDICGKMLSSRGSLLSHRRMHMGVKKYSCSVCNKAFGQKNAYKVHMMNHKGEFPFHCNLCHKKFRMKHSLKHHLAMWHKVGEIELPEYQCQRCSKKFHLKVSYQYHIDHLACRKNLNLDNTSKHDGKTHACTFCDTVYRHERSLIRHKKVRHNAGKDDQGTFKKELAIAAMNTPTESQSSSVIGQQPEIFNLYHQDYQQQQTEYQQSYQHKKYQQPVAVPPLYTHYTVKSYDEKIQEYQTPPPHKPVYEPPIEVVQQTYELPPQASSSRVKQESVASPQYEFIFEDHIEEVSENEAAVGDEYGDYLVQEIEEVKVAPTRQFVNIKEEVVKVGPILFMEPAPVKAPKLVEPTKHIRRSKVKIEVKPDLANDKGDFTYKFAKPAGKPMDFQCHLCPKQFSKKHYMNRHIKNSHSIDSKTGCRRLRVCDLCGKSVTQLAEHMKAVHYDIRPYTCDYCGKSVRQKNRIKLHLMIHSGERHLPCPHCPLRFRYYKNLKNHIIQHAGLKPHVCDVCGRGFVDKSHMQIHRETHLNLKYQCEGCEIVFKHHQNFKNHVKKCVGTVPIRTCALCSKSYKQEGSVINHIIQVHPQDMENPLFSKLLPKILARSKKPIKKNYL